MTPCPCGSLHAYEDCCGPLIHHQKPALTPESLMRSRYTAYTQANIAYIQATMAPPASLEFDAAAAQQWAQSVQWLSLKVLRAFRKGEQGFVEFIATCAELRTSPLKRHKIQELSEFHQHEGQWRYVKGYSHLTKNDPCPCKSGKKYKQCCGP